MKNLIKSFLLVVTTFFILGCGGAGTAQPSPSAMPSWYLNQPLSNPIYYQGVGIGSSKEESRTNALVNVGAEISQNVKSSTDMTISDVNGQISEKSKLRTQTSIENIKFTGVRVIENQYIAGKFYTYLQVDRDVLFQAQKSEMDIKYNKLKSLYEHAKSNNVFELIKNRPKIDSDVGDIKSKLSILKAISPDFDKSKYTDTVSKISNETRNSVVDAMVYVTNKNASSYQDIVKKYISSYGMTLVDSPNKVANKKNLLAVNITKTAEPKKVKTSDPRLKGASFANVVITLTTKSNTNKTIAQNRIKVVNISKKGYNDAVKKTSKFEREIKRQGILNILLDKSSK